MQPEVAAGARAAAQAAGLLPAAKRQRAAVPRKRSASHAPGTQQVLLQYHVCALQLLTHQRTASGPSSGLAAIRHVCDCTGCGCRRSSPHQQPIQSSRQRALVPSLQRAAKVGAQRQPSGVQPARRGLHTGGEQLVPPGWCIVDPLHGTHRPPGKCKLGVYIMTDEMHMHSRWSKERYKTAQASLVSILRDMNANGPASAILRPTLRDEARKSIGDTGAHVLLFASPFLQLHVYLLSGATCCRSRQSVRMLHLHRCLHFARSPGAAGLLDHLLKHATDAKVTEEGHRLRRRHNRDGHMEYWLALPNAADAGGASQVGRQGALSGLSLQQHTSELTA